MVVLRLGYRRTRPWGQQLRRVTPGLFLALRCLTTLGRVMQYPQSPDTTSWDTQAVHVPAMTHSLQKLQC